MQSTQSSGSGFQMNNTQVIVGAVLIGAGGLIGMVGVIIGGTALAAATRRWMNELEVPPTEVVKHKWHQTRAATTAGAQAWQSHNGVHAHSGRS